MEDQIAAPVKTVNDGRVSNDARLEAIQLSIEMWGPAVTNLHQQLDELCTHVGRIVLHPTLASAPATPEDAVVRPRPTDPVDDARHHGPDGHGAIIDTGIWLTGWSPP